MRRRIYNIGSEEVQIGKAPRLFIAVHPYPVIERDSIKYKKRMDRLIGICRLPCIIMYHA